MKRLVRFVATVVSVLAAATSAAGCANRSARGSLAPADTTVSLEGSKRWIARLRAALGPDSLDVPMFFVPALQESTPGAPERTARFLAVPSDSGQIVTVFTSEYRLRSYVEDINRTEHLDRRTLGYAVRRFTARGAGDLADQLEGSGLGHLVIDRSFYCNESEVPFVRASALRDTTDAVLLWVANRSAASSLVERWSRRAAVAIRQGQWRDANGWLVDIVRCVPGEPRTLVMLGLCAWKLGDRQVVAAVDNELGRFDPEMQMKYRSEVGEPSARPLIDEKARSLVDRALEIPIRSMHPGD